MALTVLLLLLTGNENGCGLHVSLSVCRILTKKQSWMEALRQLSFLFSLFLSCFVGLHWCVIQNGLISDDVKRKKRDFHLSLLYKIMTKCKNNRNSLRTDQSNFTSPVGYQTYITDPHADPDTSVRYFCIPTGANTRCMSLCLLGRL